ncbi:MAG: penicillin-binding protein 2 [Chloroflexi bacterium]|nr:penicillin-binding protein 2 [Chloroflexota bacterium]
MTRGARDPAESRRWRLLTIGTVIALFSGVLIAKLTYLQVIQADRYQELARQEHWRKETIPAQRGAIRSSAGQPLALSVPFESLYADTKFVEHPETAARRLASVLGEKEDELRAKLLAKQDAPTLLKPRLGFEMAQQIRQLKLWDVYLRPEPVRKHPEGSLAAEVLGFVGHDHQGLAGLEASLDEQLGGRPGTLYAERDTGGDEIALGLSRLEVPRDGVDVTLTIDRFAQRIVERELEAALKKWRAASGSVIVMQPSTGAILAMASRPSFRFDEKNDGLPTGEAAGFRNAAVNDQYEPGSVFKVITMAAGIDNGTVTPETTVDDPGFFTFGGITVRNWNGQGYGRETMRSGLAHSNNVVLGTVSTRLGKVAFYRYLDAFGFGKLTGVALPGEAAGTLRRPGGPDGWSNGDLLTNSFGQGLAATPLQMAAAVSAIANSGVLMKPQIVKETSGPDGRRVQGPIEVRRVISSESARTITDMMVTVVESSPTRPAVIPGYRVAGKTGTSEVPTPAGYSKLTIASFGGFVPVERPAFAMIIKIDQPQENPWGEVVAAPLFNTIAKQLLVHYRVPPTRELAAR